ncbi:MAG: hypothetical protein VKS61_01730 [Candidatus Sericytochromatia bacterium]|nr:hypothetical protein [Candidatus Sericytochromatia bacterium]
MPVRPVRPPAPVQALPRVAGKAWAIDLPALPGNGLAPAPTGERPAPPRALDGNVTYLNGRNLSYTVKGSHHVSLPYLTAWMVDHTPADPLDLWAIGSYTLRVKAGRIDVREEDLNGALRETLKDLPGLPVTGVRVGLHDGNRVTVGARLKVGPLPVPVSTRLQITPVDARTLTVNPEAVRVLGLPVGWALRLLRIDVPRMLGLPADGPLTQGPRGRLVVDLNRVASLQADLAGLGIARGRATIVLGGQPDPDVGAARRRQNPNWAEVINGGEALLETGIIRNVRVVITDNTPSDPFNLNRWDQEGLGHVEHGEVILPEKILTAKFGQAGGEGFFLDAVRLEGVDLVVEGSKEVLGFPIPVKFKLRFSRSDQGELLMTPHSVKVAGLGFGKDQIIAAIRSMPGMVQRGEAFVVDLKTTGSIEMPPLRRVSAEPGRIVLTP